MRTEIILTIIAMAGATFLTRFASPALLGGKRMPVSFERFLRHVPTAILTALIAPCLLAPRGYLDISSGNSYLIAGSIAAVLAYFRQPSIITMGGGIIAMLVLRSMGFN